VRLLLLARHGQSLFNVDGVVNGDPAHDRGLSKLGITEATSLGAQLAPLAIDLCVTSRFPRAQETAQIALGGRAARVPHEIDADLDDIKLGELEGRTLADYRAWKRGRSRDEPFPGGGESLNDAARRYAGAFERLGTREEEVVLCLCHEIPVRYAVNAAAGSNDLDRPLHDVANATPYLFDPAGVERAVARIRELSGSRAAGR
jgi:broad specificity phosphatase PhoE